jgi:opacity protein-like surface antigen
MSYEALELMKRIFLLLPVIALTIGVSAGEATAQRIDSPYRFMDTNQFVGVWGGQLQASEGRLDMGPQPAPIFGANWAIRLSNAFAIGADVAFSPSTRTVRDTTHTVTGADTVFDAIGEADINLIIGMANVRLNLTGARTWNRLQPYIMFGGGVAIDASGAPILDQDLEPNVPFDFGTSFAGQFGGGVEWFPTGRVSVRLDARNMLWKLSVPDAFRLTEVGRTLRRSQWEQNFVAAAGLSFHF